jgi:hypothetical protein
MQFRTDRAIDLNGNVYDISDLKLTFDFDEHAPFWVLYAERITYGFGWKPGQIIVCAQTNDMIVKGWRYRNASNNEPWIKCQDATPGFLSRYKIPFFEINSPRVRDCNYSIWTPTHESSCTGLGEVRHYKRDGLQPKRSLMSFSEFMQKHYSHLLEIVANLQ